MIRKLDVREMMMDYYLNFIFRNVKDFTNINMVNDFINNLKIKENSKRMVAYYYKRWAINNNVDVSDLQKYKQISEPKKALTENEFFLLLKNTIDDQQRLILLVFYHTGIRLCEYPQLDFLNFENYDEKYKVFLIKTAKTNQYRWVRINSEILDLAEKVDWKISRDKIRKIFSKTNKIAKELNITTNITPHVLRHTCASVLVNDKMASIDEVADYLGDRVETVRHYYVTLSPERISLIGGLLDMNECELLSNNELSYRHRYFLLLKKNRRLVSKLHELQRNRE